MRRFKQGIAILAIASMALMTACGKNNSTANAVTSATLETTTEADAETTETVDEATTEASMEATTPEETTPEEETTEAETTAKQTESATTAKQNETTTAKQTEAATTAKQTEPATTAKQTEPATTAKQTEAPTQAPNQTLKKFNEYSVGDVITFGKYDNHYLEWIIGSKTGNNTINLICKNVIKKSQMHNNNAISTYEDSAVNKWLLGDFKSAAFTAQQAKSISTLSLISPYTFEDFFGNGGDSAGSISQYAVGKTFDGEKTEYWTNNIYTQLMSDENICYYVTTNGICTSSVEENLTLVKGIRPYMSIKVATSETPTQEATTTVKQTESATTEAATQAPKLSFPKYEDCEEGDTITMGSYNGKDIEWVIVEKVEKGFAAVSKYVVDMRPLHRDSNISDFEGTDLDKWFKDDFAKNVFSKYDQSKIIPSVDIPCPTDWYLLLAHNYSAYIGKKPNGEVVPYWLQAVNREPDDESEIASDEIPLKIYYVGKDGEQFNPTSDATEIKGVKVTMTLYYSERDRDR